MKNFRKVLTMLLVTIGIGTSFAQITADEAVVAMGRGINLGNTLDAPNYEGEWAPAAKEYYFDMYKDAGFQCVRIPITWNKRVATASPYTIDEDFLKRVDTIIGWALDRDMYAIINVHHDGWVKKTTTFDANKPRLYAIWEQLSERYKNHPEGLFFEVINEPHSEDGSLTTAQVNEVNSKGLEIIRADNPTRIVIYGGPNWSSSNDLMNAAIPDASDEYLMGYYHSYDPWSFAGEGIGTWGTNNDKQAMINQMSGVQEWSETNSIPVLIGEFGAVHDCDYNSRMRYYAHYTEQALAHGMAFAVWDDGGWFEVLERNDSAWDETIELLIHTTPQSPTNVVANYVKAEDTTIVVSWTNRANDFDTLYLEKRMSNSDFTTLAKFTGDSTSFTDTVFEVKSYYYYRLIARYNDSIDVYSHPANVYITPTKRAPFNGTPFAVPGVIQAEDFDEGGEGLTYHDITASIQGDALDYRTGESVDIEIRNEGGFQVGYADVGEWLEYTIDVVNAGEYELVAHLASEQGGGIIQYKFPNTISSQVTAPKTSSWQTTATVSTLVNLEAGEQIMRVIIADIPNYNIDKFEFRVPSSTSNIVNDNLYLYPNPAKNTLHIMSATLSTDATIEIVSISGVIVMTSTIQQLENGLDIENLSAGYYMVVIKDAQGLVTKKFLKK